VIVLKSPAEIDRMREAGRVTALTLQRVVGSVRPGMTTGELDRIAEKSIRSEGCTPSFLGYQPRGARSPFPGSICSSLNDEIVHGIPHDGVYVREGDLLKIDVGAVYQGYHGDAAATVFVGGAAPSEDAERLVTATERALQAGIQQARAGGRLQDVSHAIEETGARARLGVVQEYGGHGVGRALHEEPFLPNIGRRGRGLELRPGLVLAIEPMFNLGTWETKLADDDWTVVTADGSLSAHYEHTVAITADGPEILTALRV
jgi:methionyl aminopeptidase